MRTFAITITGTTPLLMHWDNIAWADKMEAWKNDPANKSKSRAGDDRTPAFRWLGTMYHDEEHIALPSDNLMKTYMEGGAMVPVPGGKNGKTFKAQTQSGGVTGEAFWKVQIRGKLVEVKPLLALIKEDNFDRHQEAASKNGFTLFVKRAKVGTSKHIRVRPRFDDWSASGTLNVWDDALTLDVLRSIWNYAGQYKGIGAWRPGGKTPGSYGMFKAEVKAL